MPNDQILSLGSFEASLLINPRLDPRSDHLAGLSPFTVAQAEATHARITAWPAYKVTPLRKLSGAAAHLGLGALYCKDESGRLGLSSFKALGAIFASVSEVSLLLEERLRREVDDGDLLRGRYADDISDVVLVCATDGNHGFSVASAAGRMGCRARIYIPAGVSSGRERALRDTGADVVRIDGIYEDAYEAAETAAREEAGARMISDYATPHYRDIPARCMAGYAVMAREFVSQLGDELPTHIMLTAGCGGLAAAMISAVHQLLGPGSPKFIIVEPITADCVFASAVAGRSTRIGGDLETIMGGLACAAVSHIAWPIIDAGAYGFVRLNDTAAADAMRFFAHPKKDDPVIVAGETGAAGLAGVLAICESADARKLVGFDEKARVLVINCEGATDPEQYQALTGSTAEAVGARVDA